ncbi:MAG TPA: hypothetical protein VMU09_12945, partial [Acidimicrobiales bacterium]|nr:hypothetical protein [Acidimicrobiales bacterium]
EAAADVHRAAAAMAPGPTFREAHFAALLDLAECHLAAGDLDRAAAAVAHCAGIEEWTGAMSWRHRTRHRLLGDVLTASAGGNGAMAAEDDLRALAAEARRRGDPRYAWRAELAGAAARARRGEVPAPGVLTELVRAGAALGGPDGWRAVGELALATRSDELWREAERRAGSVVRAAARRSGVDAGQVAGAVRAQVDALRP